VSTIIGEGTRKRSVIRKRRSRRGTTVASTVRSKLSSRGETGLLVKRESRKETGGSPRLYFRYSRFDRMDDSIPVTSNVSKAQESTLVLPTCLGAWIQDTNEWQQEYDQEKSTYPYTQRDLTCSWPQKSLGEVTCHKSSVPLTHSSPDEPWINSSHQFESSDGPPVQPWFESADSSFRFLVQGRPI
jgi:hypothetical protein